MTEVRFEKNICLFCYTFLNVMIYTNISILLTQTVLHSAVLFPSLLGEPAPLLPTADRGRAPSTGQQDATPGAQAQSPTIVQRHHPRARASQGFLFRLSKQTKRNINPNRGTNERRRSANAVAGLGR